MILSLVHSQYVDSSEPQIISLIIIIVIIIIIIIIIIIAGPFAVILRYKSAVTLCPKGTCRAL
jgi:hypothetical protein